MGLDISAYSGLERIPDVFPRTTEGDPIGVENYVTVQHNNYFRGRCDDLDDGAQYTYKDCMAGFGASYSYWSFFREWLAEIAGHEPGDYTAQNTSPDDYHARQFPRQSRIANDLSITGPFVELLAFSDCDGCIGTAVCAKLAKDFADLQAKADAAPLSGHYRSEHEVYAKMRHACEFASNGGCLKFH